MIRWKTTAYGYHVIISDPLTLEEATEWTEQTRETVSQRNSEFVAFFDLRKFTIVPPECKDVIEELERYCIDRGLKRTVMIVNDELTAGQLKVSAQRTGAYAWERQIDASANPDWENVAMDWLLHGTDPDIRAQNIKTVSDS